jgi:histidinol phosphatase-like PHP family hydrolase
MVGAPLPDPSDRSASTPRHVDWHCHSYWSDGVGTVAQLAAVAESKNVTLGISDHGFIDNPRLRTRDHIAAYLGDLEQHDVLRGIEISIGEKGSHSAAERRLSRGQLTLTDLGPAEPSAGLLDRFDYVIASLHDVHIAEGIVYSTPYLNWRAGVFSTYRPDLSRYDRRAYMDSLLAALEDSLDRWPITILGHFCLLPELASDDPTDPELDPEPDATAAAWLDTIIRLCVKRNVAVELNSKSRVPHRNLAERAYQLGARFSLGSDAHTLTRAGDLAFGVQMLRELGIPPDRVLTASSLRAK